ncbi:hypothetical protein [Rhizobium leguminosarum]|uniref:hypothetical protein n=1 Tax=Rhizobium leguminosarum TaxID=384 RepID=UPI001C912378|nr:hypothetical protein [Rhizobium leguminosarum]MBY2986401.1 hypothetical protein [Rhizobium leguminosarum]
MTDLSAIQEEIDFLTDELRSLKARIGAAGNSVQLHKLAMLSRLRDRCERSKQALERKGQAA